jgi:hypothetical protein
LTWHGVLLLKKGSIQALLDLGKAGRRTEKSLAQACWMPRIFFDLFEVNRYKNRSCLRPCGLGCRHFLFIRNERPGLPDAVVALIWRYKLWHKGTQAFD